MLWKFNFIHTAFDKANPITAASALPIPLGLSLDTFAARFQFPGIELLRFVLPVIMEWPDSDYFPILDINGGHV